MSPLEMLARLVSAGNRFRMTPIVDDDFPAMRDMFDETLAEATRLVKQDRPRIVCLCGSTRFYEVFQRANYDETMAGRIVLSVGHYPHSAEQAHGESVGCTPEQKAALDVLHKQKIDLADEVLILNVGGYIGDSTRSEIAHARATGKPIRWLEPESE